MTLGEHLAVGLHFDLVDHKEFILRAPSDMNFASNVLIAYAKVVLKMVNVVYHSGSQGIAQACKKSFSRYYSSI